MRPQQKWTSKNNNNKKTKQKNKQKTTTPGVNISVPLNMIPKL